MAIFSQLIFPIFGIMLIGIGVGSFLFKYGERIGKEAQKLSFLGVSLEISVVTAVILTGIIFCGLGFYLNERSYKIDFDKATATIDARDKEIEGQNRIIREKNDDIIAMRTQNITYHFALNDLDEKTAPPPANSLLCIFYKNYRDKTDSAVYNVYPSGASAFKVTFQNLSLQQLEDAAPAVYLYDKKTHKRWVCLSFNPLTPTMNLLPDNE